MAIVQRETQHHELGYLAKSVAFFTEAQLIIVLYSMPVKT